VKGIDNLNLMTATSAETGLVIARKEVPDIIILDINLPGMNGFEAASELKNDPKILHIPLLALSADMMPNTIQKASEFNVFVEYLSKPFDVSQLIHLLVGQQLLQKR